jgi:hypothetical protein
MNLKMKDVFSTMTPQEMSLWILLHMLFLTEGPLSLITNILIMFKIRREHHDIFSPFKNEFCDKLSDIEELSLDIRLKFLSLHGFEFMGEICQKNIRNAIAHISSLMIDADGTVHIKNKILKRKEIETRLFNMNELLKRYSQILLRGQVRF